MKIILSRKGIDGGIGKKPSPLLCGQDFLAPISIPIFDDYSKIKSDEIILSGNRLTDLIESLGVNQGGLRFIHLDPDLDEKSIPRKKGWRAMYGQSRSPLGHLNKHKIGAEDLFLFFGWFKETEQSNGAFYYKENTPDIHLFFGWLQVGEVLDAEGKSFDSLEKEYPWGHSHPHFGKKNGLGHGKIFLAKEFLQLEGLPVTSLPGAGIFRRFTNQAQLTFEGEKKTIHLEAASLFS